MAPASMPRCQRCVGWQATRSCLGSGGGPPVGSRTPGRHAHPMKFGIFYELQLPKPWGADDERQLVQDALVQVELADRLGIDYAWAVEHHFLEEYSHCSASEVFLAAAAARTQRIRLGHGIRQVIANYNHPARTAEAIAMLDLVSNGRAEFRSEEHTSELQL